MKLLVKVGSAEDFDSDEQEYEVESSNPNEVSKILGVIRLEIETWVVADERPCPDCGVYPGDPHNAEAHMAEWRAAERRMYEPDEFLEAEYEDRFPSDDE